MTATTNNSIRLNLYHVEGKNYQRMDAEDSWTVAAENALYARHTLTFGSDSVTTDDRIAKVVHIGWAELDKAALEKTKYQNCGGWIL